MPDKVKLEVNKGEAVIKEGGDSFIGKLLAQKGKLKIRKQGRTAELEIVQPTAPAAGKPKKAKK